jgi:hypothetical protein
MPYFLATAEMLIPGCSASRTIAFFSAADQRRLLCTLVITSMGTIYTFSLVAVLSLYLFLQLISRSKVSGLIGGYFNPIADPTSY